MAYHQNSVMEDEDRCVFTQIFTMQQSVVDAMFGIPIPPKVHQPHTNSSSSETYSDSESCSYSLEEIKLPEIHMDAKLKCRALYFHSHASHGVTSAHVRANWPENASMEKPARSKELAEKCTSLRMMPMKKPTMTMREESYRHLCGED
jgi:hypothetical protein